MELRKNQIFFVKFQRWSFEHDKHETILVIKEVTYGKNNSVVFANDSTFNNIPITSGAFGFARS